MIVEYIGQFVWKFLVEHFFGSDPHRTRQNKQAKKQTRMLFVLVCFRTEIIRVKKARPLLTLLLEPHYYSNKIESNTEKQTGVTHFHWLVFCAALKHRIGKGTA